MDIELRHLSVGYDGKAVATDISATIKAGRLVCLIGRNGAGKSTLLRTMAGFQPELSGEILLGGRLVSSLSAREMAETVGVVLTERIESQNLTVRELVSLGRLPYTGFFGRLSSADENIVDEVLEQVGIGALAQQKVAAISDGERQKAMIAKVLAQQSPVILLDEPSSFLDFSSKVELLELLKSLAHDSGRTILITTHDISLARSFADELWLIDNHAVIISPTSSQITDFVGAHAAHLIPNL